MKKRVKLQTQLNNWYQKEGFSQTTYEPYLRSIGYLEEEAGQGQITSRQAAKEAGLAWDVTTETINKVCASGLRALSLADQIIRSGDEQVIVAGGMESMSHAPYLNKAMRWGAKMGDIKMHDSMLTDGLTCAFTQ